MSSEIIEGFILSPQQKSLWFDQRDSQQFRARCAVLVEGQLETEVLKDAVRLVVNRHEILRTTFQRRPGMTQPFQVIAAEGEKSWQERDLSELSLADQHARIEQLFSAESAREFDLEHGPLVSFSLLTLNERRHVLLINLPALCADDRTLQNITAEIGDAYASICGGAELEEVSLQYADFAIWQNELLEGEEAAAGLAYWQKQDARACLRQPVPFARVAEKDFAPGDINLRLDLQTSAKIHAAVRRYDTSTEAFLLACWHTLLWRLTGEEEVSVGSRFDGRKYDELARAVGLFSRQLPIRHSFEKRQRFRDVLEQIGRSMREAAEWEEYFIRERHLPERTDDALSTAFFPIGFEFTELPAPVEQAGIRLTLYRQEACADPFALKLRVTGTAEGGLEIALHYDGSRVAREDAERLCGHYHRLLQSVVENASDSLGALRIVDDGERRRILSEFNDTAADFGAAQCIHELFERQAALTPERVAVVFEEEQLTYEELNRRANQVAHYLRESGVGGETLVAILLERSINVVVSFLGVLKAGAAYAPLDPAYPAERLRTMLKEAQVEMVLTEERFVALLPESLPSIHVDRHLPLIQQQPITTPPTQVSGHNLAYVIFTSGSTGAPKGVAIEHRQLFNYLRGVVERIDFPEAARFATVSTFAADLGHTMIFPALCGGGTLHIIAQERATDPQELAAYFRQHRVDCLKIVPSHLQALLTHGRPEEVLPARRLVLGGEASRWDLIEQVGRLAPECRVFNHYGPTETTVGAISGEVETVKGESGERGESVALGRPLGNMAVYILGDGLEPVPVGVAGEVYLGGEGVGRGYLRRPELTAERFIPDPFGAVGGRRMYRTGDVARYLPDGRIEFLGRGDNQVKFHGFRVELNEIRSELNRHPQISDSLITLGKGSGGNEMMVAYYVARQELPVAELREFLSENIIEETIPNAFIHLPKLPLTPNGKINFQALPSVEESRRKVRRTGVAPRTPTEQVLASIWADVLQVGQVSVDDNFFELGGHSLMATQVISRLREAFQRELPLRDLFEAPTVAEMAQRVEAALKGDEQASAPAIERVSRTSPLPLSFAQQRLWFADQLEPGNPAYNILGAVRFKGQLDSNALERSLNEIVKRHETLRTTFTVVEGQPAQVVAESLRIPMPLVDLSALEGTKREAKVLELGAAESRRPFDLATGPLLRVTLLRLAEAEHVLLLGMHHIVSDAWSVGVLARELGAFYAALSEGKQAELPSLPVQYADFAHWQRNWLEGENLESQLAYWKKQLAGAPPVLELPTDYPRPQAQSFRGAKHHHALPYTLTETLKTLSRREGTTLFMTLLAAFQVLLRRYTNQEDIVVGTDIANRNRHEIEGLIGFFVNHPVLRTNLSGNPTFRELLGRVREATLGAYAHQDVPFEKLLGLRKTERSLSHLPLFQVLLVLRNTPSEPLELPGLTLELIEIENETAKFDVALFMEETAAGLVGNWNYSTDLFKPETITLMSEHFEEVLRAAAARPDARLDELTIHGAPASGAQQTPPPAWNEPESPSIDETARSYVAPQTDIEKRLAEIWSQVLGVEQIGIHDNFFELGGDSIISIQIIAKANQHGLRLTPKQFFQQQTIAELATVVGTTPTVKAEQGIVTGALPLTPIQRRFFKQNLPRREYFNQSILLEVDRPLIPALVEQTVQHLLAHHDALRLRYTPTEENEWQQRNAETGDAAPFSALDFSALPEAEQQAAIEAAIETMQASLNISDGPLIKVAHIACGESRANLLLLVVHHLAIDVVSWRILLEDLQAVYQHLSEGKKPSLPAKTTSFKQWAERLSQHVRGGGFREEIAYWTDELRNQPRPLPSDHPAGQANTLESARVVSTKLEASATRALLVDVPQAYHTQINDVLLTALVQAFAGWTGTRSLLVEMEGHGRESIFEDVDLSRTVGWFTSVFPVLLDLGRNGDSPGDELKAVKEKLRRLPNRGIGYGLLGHLSVDTEVVELWKTFPQPQVSFNYLGQFEQEAADASIFGRVRDARGASPLMPGDRTHLLEIDAKVVGEQLQVSWTYSENAHRRATVEALAENFNERLRALGQHCLSPEAGGYTPSDFPEAELSQADLDNLLASLNA